MDQETEAGAAAGDEAAETAGPVLQAGAAADAVIAAIRELNEGVEVTDRGAYLRVLVPGGCRVTREAIARHRGGAFRLPGDLEQIMSSFKGWLTVTEDDARWQPRRPAAARRGVGGGGAP